MKKLLLLFSILLLTVYIACGQSSASRPINNQYVLNPVSINPSFAGGYGALNLFTFYGKQWVGVEGSPSTIAFSVDAPFADQKLGLGLMVESDKIGVTKENLISTSYAYRIDMNTGMLAFGLGASIVLTNTAFSDLVVLDPGDEIYLADTRTFGVPNFSFGANYSYRNFFAGFSIPKLLSYSFDFGKNKYVLDNDFSNYSYLLNTGYMFNVSEKIMLFPSLLMRYSAIPSPSKFQYDINMNVGFFDRFWVGGSFRNRRNAAAMFQFQPTDQMKIAYSYNYEISELGRYSNGSHEIMLRYVFKYKVDAINPLNF